jgi:formylglycine-generating enzyme required for sulfatase activity
MGSISDTIERLSRYALSWTEFTSVVLFVLTALLIVLTYALVRDRWIEASAWGSLITATLAIQFMLLGWREVAVPEQHEMPGVVVRNPDGAGVHFKECPACPEMVVIPPGYFIMGADDTSAPEEGPLRKMMIAKRFAIGRQAVTNVEYKAFTIATGRKPAVCDPRQSTAMVACVSWADAQAYTAWLRQQTGMTYRLASAAEWEYAGRAGAPAPVAARDGGVILASLSTPQASVANGFGLAGMGADVREMVDDCWSPTLSAISSNGSAYRPLTGCSSRVVKGGHEVVGARRFTARRPIEENAVFADVGFRVVREMPRLQK